MEKLPIPEVKKELGFLKEDWKFDKAEEDILPLSYRVHQFMEIVKDDMKYSALQLLGVPKRMLSDVIDYLKPIINDPYWEEVYGKDNFLRLFRIPKESHIHFPSTD